MGIFCTKSPPSLIASFHFTFTHLAFFYSLNICHMPDTEPAVDTNILHVSSNKRKILEMNRLLKVRKKEKKVKSIVISVPR